MEKQGAVSPPADRELLEFNLADEEQILDELQGKVFDASKYVYKIKNGSYQLSYLGVKYACRLFAEKGEAIEIDGFAEVKYDPASPEYLWAQIRAKRVKIDPKTGQRIVLDSAIGAKRKWIHQELKDGKGSQPDPFFYEKAIGCAQRNAKQALLPQDFVLEFIQTILKQARPGGASQAPPPGAESSRPPQGASAPQSAPAQKANGGKKSQQSELSVLHQQFWVALKQACNTQDEKAARAGLKALTGEEKVSNLSPEVLKKLGGILRKVSSKEAEIRRDDANLPIIVHLISKEVIWPLGYKKLPEAAPTAPPAAARSEVNAPPGGGDWMF